MKKEVKFYLHHDLVEPVSYTKQTGVFGNIIRFFIFLIKSLVNLCYIVGFGVIEIIKLPITIIKFIYSIPSRTKSIFTKIHLVYFRRKIAIFSLTVLISVTGIYGLNLVASGMQVKGRVLGTSDTGLNYLQEAKTSLESQNFELTQQHLTKALEAFKNSKETLDSADLALQGVLAVIPQKYDADNLISSAQLITQAGIQTTQLLQLLSTVKIGAIGLDAGTKNKQTLEKAQQLLDSSVMSVNLAAEKLNKVSISTIPESKRSQFIAAKDIATIFQTNSDTMKDVYSLLFQILLGQKNVLIVFQNNNELRASGGFMGTVGKATLVDGSIKSLDIRSVYDYDGQLKENIVPPQPIIAVNDKWFLRDSNWFASFPESAGRISSMYEKEGGETPDLIIVLTPEVILDMLDKTGPITLPQHNVTLTKDNFIEQTQTETSVNYDKTLNQPKQFLADFFPILMDKLSSSGGLMNYIEVMQKNLSQKQILLWSRSTELQNKILALNWGGKLAETDRDYLGIVTSNLGGTKTDRYIQRSSKLLSEITKEGVITNTIKFTVTNPLPNEAGLENKSFIRFYVPEGSNLISSSGFNSDIQIPRLDLTGYVQDEFVKNWQSEVKQDTVSGTNIGKESGKTWFGNWLVVNGGESKTVTLTYALPFKLKPVDHLSLIVQKQPGTLEQNFEYEVKADDWNRAWETGIFNSSLKSDSFFGLVLHK